MLAYQRVILNLISCLITRFFFRYAWTVALCKECRRHVGWKFTAVEGNLRPRAFWGVTRRSLKDKELKVAE